MKKPYWLSSKPLVLCTKIVSQSGIYRVQRHAKITITNVLIYKLIAQEVCRRLTRTIVAVRFDNPNFTPRSSLFNNCRYICAWRSSVNEFCQGAFALKHDDAACRLVGQPNGIVKANEL